LGAPVWHSALPDDEPCRDEALGCDACDMQRVRQAGNIMIRYDEHAEFQMKRRDIAKEWVADAILKPDEIETSGNRQSFLKRLPGRHVMLRVVTARDDVDYVITAYFDRTKPCG